MKNKKWFSLLEVLMSVVILGILIWTILTIFWDIKWADWKMLNKRILTSEASDLIDKMHEAALNYTIDYEEYFNRNRKWLWVIAIGPEAGIWETWFTSYGNDGELYYCSRQINPTHNKFQIYRRKDDDYWCEEWVERVQKYLEYYFQHWRLWNINELNSIWNSWAYQWKWPIAINPNTWIDYLYLINEDWDERYYFRRKLIERTDIDWNSNIDKNEKLAKIQILKLKWFDAWSWHDFRSRWAYDWFIDTRACDSSQWFYCNWYEVKSWYSLPINEDDWREDIITNWNVTVSEMKIDIYPAKDPYLAINEEEYRIDPYAKISFTMNIYKGDLKDEITISTTLWFKNSYSRFPVLKFDWYIPDEKND